MPGNFGQRPLLGGPGHKNIKTQINLHFEKYYNKTSARKVWMPTIQNVNIDRLALAPMAGVTDIAFRTICRERGRLLPAPKWSARRRCTKTQKPGSPQLGEDEHPAAADIRQQPEVIGDHGGPGGEISGADIDINMGCPWAKS